MIVHVREGFGTGQRPAKRLWVCGLHQLIPTSEMSADMRCSLRLSSKPLRVYVICVGACVRVWIPYLLTPCPLPFYFHHTLA